MENRQPIYEGTVMGAVSLEHTISGAALKQSRKHYMGHAVEYALLFHEFVQSEQDLCRKSGNKGLLLISSFLWENVLYNIPHTQWIDQKEI